MATVRALKPCYCGDPCALREEGDVFQYQGPKASYLELIEGEWQSTAARPQLDHDRDGREGGSAPTSVAADESGQSAGGDVVSAASSPAPEPAKPAAPKPARRGRPPARRKG